MKKDLTSVFNMISMVKNINKGKLIIYPSDNNLFYSSYFKHKIWKKTTYLKWKNCVINYSIENMVSFEDSIEYFSNWLKNNKNKNG